MVDREEVAPIDRIPIAGYQGYRPTYRNPVKKMNQSASNGFNTTSHVEQQVNHVLQHTEQHMVSY